MDGIIVSLSIISSVGIYESHNFVCFQSCHFYITVHNISLVYAANNGAMNMVITLLLFGRSYYQQLKSIAISLTYIVYKACNLEAFFATHV